MQTVYIGDTLINDVYLGSIRASEVTNTPPKLVTSSLVYYFDASISASAANWRTVLPYGSKTGSLFQSSYTTDYPQTFILTGSIATIEFAGGTPSELQTNPYTLQILVYQKNDTALTNLTWWGNSGGGQNIQIQTSGSIGNNKFVRFDTPNSSSLANNIPFTLNDWHLVSVVVTGSRFDTVSLWVDNNKQNLGGTTTFGTIGTLYWAIGTNNSQNALSGSVVSYSVYNRALSDSEILQNYTYFRNRLGYI